MFKQKKLKFFSAVILPICVFLFVISCFASLSTAETISEPADAASIDSYYAGLDESLRGDAFRTQLASLITTTHKYNPTYGGLAGIFDESDADPNKAGNILWFYTGTSVSFNGSFSSGTNREHVWPKNAGSAFPETTDAGSDAHHLRPTNANLNSTRGNNSFGEVAEIPGNIVKENGSTNYKNLCYQSNSVFYPGVGYRGATARILMYVQTRWGNAYNLTFVLGKGNNKTIGDIEDLMKWHIEEPPTEAEKVRNEVVYGIQGNRNPFIDHPEYAEMIYCNDGKSYNDELQAVAKKYGSYLSEDEYPDVDIGGGSDIGGGNGGSDIGGGNGGSDIGGGSEPEQSLITVTEFATLVNAVVNAESLEAKWNTIKLALDGYKKLNATDKQTASASYATLKQEITAYNNKAASVNAEATKATEQAISMLLGSFPILSVAAYFLLKR